MEFVHHSIWKVVGIYEAIMRSVCKVHTDEDLIFGLAERWCFFLDYPVTTEDMMILGGLSDNHTRWLH